MRIVLKFKPSEAVDVVSYKLYASPSENEEMLDKETAEFNVNLGKPEVDSEGFMNVALNDIPEVNDFEGEYDFGITAIDEAGNESPLLAEGFQNVNVDFIAPDPPTAGSVLYLND
jgi:hypothetical protein